MAACADGPKIFQLYMQGDLDWAREVLARVRNAGYDAVCLTVDTPYHSRRDRSILNPMPGRRPGARSHDGPNHLASVTWETLDRLREMAELPFILKGVMTAEDAALAVEHGVDAVWVSNHGGRQLDHDVGTLDVLPESSRPWTGAPRSSSMAASCAAPTWSRRWRWARRPSRSASCRAGAWRRAASRGWCGRWSCWRRR